MPCTPYTIAVSDVVPKESYYRQLHWWLQWRNFRLTWEKVRKKWVTACIRISPPESADLRSAWLLNRSADRFSEFCSDFRNQPSSMLESSGCTLETDRLADSMRKPEGRACRCQRAVPCWKTGTFFTHSVTQWVKSGTTTRVILISSCQNLIANSSLDS